MADKNFKVKNGLDIGDNIVVLNSNVTSSPTTNAGIEVERGTSANVSLGLRVAMLVNSVPKARQTE